VTLTDDAGKSPLANLGDGAEVAILAWKPGPGGTTRYRVRATESDTEGWLPVANLRSTQAAVSSTLSASASPAVTPVRHRVGAFAERRVGRRSAKNNG
jgi:hypothetical protein